MLQHDNTALTPNEIDRIFGEGFGEAMADLEVGIWQGPLESGYGFHLLRIDEHLESALPAFEDVRELVRRDFDGDRRLQMNERFYQALRDRYDIEIESPGGVVTRLVEGAANVAPNVTR